MSDVTQLNPLTFPLHGSRLIEASAGTPMIAIETVRILRVPSLTSETRTPWWY
jgi:ATP-dependent exoDNAse (exonuclease V) beta subunit